MSLITDIVIGTLLTIGGALGIYHAPEPPVTNFGLAVLTVPQGGTGATTFTTGECLKGNGTGAITTGSCGSGSGGSGSVGTSSPGVVGQLAYFTTAGATPELIAPVATGTLTANAPLSVSAARSLVGGSASLSLDTSGAWSGTAEALASNAANCSAGSAAGGVDASGAAEDCTDYWTEAENTAAGYTSNTGTVTSIATTWPITGGTITTTGTLGFNGLSTSSPIAAGAAVLYATGVNTVASVATGTVSSGTGISLDNSTRSVIGGALQITNSSPLSGLSASYPFSFSNPTLTWLGLSTTTNSGMTQGNLYVGSGGIFQSAASSSIFGYTPLNPTRQLTVAGTANQITSSAGAQDLSADRTWTLSLPNHVIFPSSFVASTGSTTNATSTNLTVRTNTILETMTSALLLTGSGGLVAEYAGTSCTNQFVRSLSALGAATCATVGAADVSLANLSATDATLTFSGTYTGATARTIGLNLGNANTWTARQTLDLLRIPSAANPSITTARDFSIDTTAASTSLRYHDGTAERVIHDIKSKTFVIASSTLAYIGSFGAAGTTTIQVWNPLRPITVVSAVCQTDTGTAHVDFHDGTNHTNDVSCSSTAGLTTTSSNNTWVILEDFKIDTGRSASTPNVITVTVNYRETAD